MGASGAKAKNVTAFDAQLCKLGSLDPKKQRGRYCGNDLTADALVLPAAQLSFKDSLDLSKYQ
ncbi:hypothetical protein F2Q70_00011640 [Brassica cretica]|uniref:Uncharacterized protein n=1 Tax=Brassica cretica TaxID=69181 RepID=A0A8S9LVD0_BRACR|nr:hypothetical protein F2Q68_00046768 [Brassica cretica]KAF2610047.1 hypothetical protein F2Q70_00011640 [Brassica cretica]